MRTLITLLALTTSTMSMDDQELRVRIKELIQTNSKSQYSSNEIRNVGWKKCGEEYHKIDILCDQKHWGSEKIIIINFHNPCDALLTDALSNYQQGIPGKWGYSMNPSSSFGGTTISPMTLNGVCPKESFWQFFFTDGPSNAEVVISYLELIYEHHAIPQGVYDSFVSAPEGVYDFFRRPDITYKYVSIPFYMKKIARMLPENPSFMDFKEAVHKNLFLLQPLTKEKIFPRINEELKTIHARLTLDEGSAPLDPAQNEIFLDYLMNDCYREAIQYNTSLLMRRIYCQTPEGATDDDQVQIIQDELNLVQGYGLNVTMMYNLIRHIYTSFFPAPSYLIKLCDLIPKDSSYFKDVFEIKGKLIFCSDKQMSIKERYLPVIESTLVLNQTEDKNNFIKAFISDGKLGGKLPSALQNLDLSFPSCMNTLDHMRTQEIMIQNQQRELNELRLRLKNVDGK